MTQPFELPRELPRSPFTMPTLDQLAAAGFDPATERYPPVEIDGVPVTGLCDALIDLVPEWRRRRRQLKALCRKAQAAAEQAAIAAEARRLLAETDHWALKAMEAGTPMPDARRAYRDALRAIVNRPQALKAWPAKPE